MSHLLKFAGAAGYWEACYAGRRAGLARLGLRRKASARNQLVRPSRAPPTDVLPASSSASSKTLEDSALIERIASGPLKSRRPSDPLRAHLVEASQARLSKRPKETELQNPEAKLSALGELRVGAVEAEGLRPLSSPHRRRALAFHGAAAAAQKPELLEMHPDRLAMQQDILRARSVGRVLAICSQDDLQGMDAVNLVTAVHRIAKLYDGSLLALTENPRFEMMLSAVAKHIDALKPRGLVHLVWSLASLQCWPDWSGSLIGRCMQCDAFTGRDVSVLLGSLAKLRKLAPERDCRQLQERLVAQLGEKLPELTTSVDLACAAAALSRLQVRDERLFVGMAQQAMPIIGDFSMSDVTSLLWAFAMLNFTHGELCGQIRGLLRQQAETCTPKELTQISWALSRLHEADEELLTQTVAPVVRRKFLDFEVPRDLCTLAFAFSNVRVFDEGVFNDFAHTLTSKVRLMNAHDVSSVVAAFAGIEYAHKGLFKALQRHTKAIMPTFTPLQLARTIHGFGTAGVEDSSLYRGLFGQALKQRHLLHASNVVEILIGLAEAEYVPEGLEDLLRDAPRLVKWLDASECIHALHALSRLQVDSKDLAVELLKTIRGRAQGWWRFKLHDMADLVEALVALELDDTLLLNICVGQLPRLLSKTDDSPAFLRLWGALADLPAHMRERVQERLHKNANLQDAVAACLSVAAEGIRATAAADSQLIATRAAAQLLCACASLSWDAAPAPDLVNLIAELMDQKEVRRQGPSQHWWPLLTWTLAELQYDDMARRALIWCLDESVVDALDTACKMRLAAAVVCLGFTEDFAGVQSLLDVDVRSDARTRPLVQSLEVEVALASTSSSEESTGLDSKARPGGAASLFDYADQVSSALIQLSIAHEARVMISGHVAQAVLPGQVAVLVQSPRDLTISGRQLGSARARTRQLTSLGWTCMELHFSEVQHLGTLQ